MLCACSLPSAGTTPSQSLGAKEDVGALPRRLWGAFVLAIVCIGFISWPLSLVYSEAQAGFGNTSLPYHGAERYSSTELGSTGVLLVQSDVAEQESSGERRSRFRNRKFLRQGPETADDPTEELYPEGILQLSAGYDDKVPEFRGSHPNRRMLIPATNVCTNKDISISQGPDDECTNKDISITQSRDGSPGMPRFSVQIVNTCVSDCAPADVHVFCGWFASSPPPNPSTFQRLAYNDCLVNGGRPLGHGAIIQFQYANSFMYPIRFRSATFCR